MRLIDADKLRHKLIMGHNLIGAKYTDMADTVEAIPIEWIEKWVEKYNKDLEPWFQGRTAVDDMLENWENQNGKEIAIRRQTDEGE